MTQTHIVLGTGFGDEGKGAIVADLVEQTGTPLKCLVIRFNGGNQAGHTVTTPTHRHVFSHFGAGTLHGARTYWSEYALFEPAALFVEMEVLKEKMKKDLPSFYVNQLSPVITPFDIMANQAQTPPKYNSCGMGIGTTVKRNLDGVKLYVHDLFCSEWHLLQKLRAVQNYYKIVPDDAIDIFINAVQKIKTFIKPIDHINYLLSDRSDQVLIFEGAQGIMLDEDFGYAPNTTWSKTTSKNAFKILQLSRYSSTIYRHYVTRGYLTRHGEGPFPNDIPFKEKPIHYAEETNIFNNHQGPFLKAPLDIQLLDHAIGCDHTENQYGTINTLHVTCMDQCPNFQFVHKNELFTNQTIHDIKLKSFVGTIRERNHP
jgi:adenylosuccinate synthase